jgi:hypothetical protein
MGRAALLACASLGMGITLTSCATSTLGYLYATTSQYGQVASLRLDINTGAIKGVSCNTGNGDQQNCNSGSGGGSPTKLIAAQGDSLLYVLNGPVSGSTTGTVSLLTLGASGGVYTSGESFASSGQYPVDMYLNPSGTYLYVLDQFQPATVSGCATPTTATCPGDITVFSVDGKGDLNVVLDLQNNSTPYFPLGASGTGRVAPPLNSGYGGNRMYAGSGGLFILDESPSGTPQIEDASISSSNGQLTFPYTATTNTAFQNLTAITNAGSYVVVADGGAPDGTSSGLLYIYSPTGTGLGSAIGSVCVGVLTGGASCSSSPTGTGSANIDIDSLLFVSNAGSSGTLYAADYANGTIFSLTYTGTGTSLFQASSNGGYTPLGTNVTCMAVSSGTTFLYASGQGNISGEQVDTSTGNLSSNDHPTTQATFTGAVPCLVFSPRT